MGRECFTIMERLGIKQSIQITECIYSQIYGAGHLKKCVSVNNMTLVPDDMKLIHNCYIRFAPHSVKQAANVDDGSTE